MRQALSLIFLTILSTVMRSSFGRPPVVAYVNNILKYGCDLPSSLALPQQPTDGPNVVILSFWRTTGPSASAAVWTNLTRYISTKCGYGTTNQEIQNTLLQIYHSKGIKLLISAFGAGEWPTANDPTQTCTTLAQFVLDNKFDGVDIDYEDYTAFLNGTGAQWVMACTKALRKYLPQGQYILTHAPAASYFTTTTHYPDGAYRNVDSQIGRLIDWYNIQYYDQGNTTYTTYQDCFVNCTKYPGAAVLQLGGLKSKVVVGKPLLNVSTGWVDTATFAGWLQRANNETGWCGGVSYWQYSLDADGSFGASMWNATASFSACNQTF